MDDLGVILEIDMDEPRILSECEKVSSEYTKKEVPFKSERMNYLMQVGINFTFINSEEPNEKVHKKIYMQDVAGDPKILGGLLTYATRFFLNKYFNVPTNEMDPDDWYIKNNEVNPEQLELLSGLLEGQDKLKDRMLTWCGVTSIEKIPADKIKSVIKTVYSYQKEQESKNAKD